MTDVTDVVLDRLATKLIELADAKARLTALRAYRDLMDAWSSTGVTVLCAEVRNALDEILEGEK